MKIKGTSGGFGGRPRARRGGFSLVEIIIVVGLLSVIMLGLLLMFNQTQRAFRTSMTQTDVMESGRAVVQLLDEGLAQITPSRYGSNTVNFYMTNFGSVLLPPVRQVLPGKTGTTVSRTNVLESVYFLTRENQQWVGIAYAVGTPDAGFGTLYRFTTNCPVREDPQILFDRYQEALLKLLRKQSLPTNMTRVVDGVVHFKVRVYGTNGFAITDKYTGVRLAITNIVVDAPGQWQLGAEAQTYVFTDNAVPLALEYEIGILEDRSLSHLRVIPDVTFQRQQLSTQVGVSSVHLFRQRVPIRNVDLSAYQ